MLSLCLFRIAVQEALQNVKKHGGVARAEVKLRRTGNTILVSNFATKAKELMRG